MNLPDFFTLDDVCVLVRTSYNKNTIKLLNVFSSPGYEKRLIENYVALPRWEGIETKKCVNSSGDFRATQDKAEPELGGLIDSETAF